MKIYRFISEGDDTRLLDEDGTLEELRDEIDEMKLPIEELYDLALDILRECRSGGGDGFNVLKDDIKL